MNEIQHYVRFRVGYEWYGISVGSVIEVLQFMALTELPDSPTEVLGMMRLREAVVPVIDLRLHFGLEEAPYNLNTPIIAASTASGPVGIVVDDVDDLVQIEESQITPQATGASHYVTGVARLPNNLLLLLDVSLLRTEIHTS